MSKLAVVPSKPDAPPFSGPGFKEPKQGDCFMYYGNVLMFLDGGPFHYFFISLSGTESVDFPSSEMLNVTRHPVNAEVTWSYPT